MCSKFDHDLNDQCHLVCSILEQFVRATDYDTIHIMIERKKKLFFFQKFASCVITSSITKSNLTGACIVGSQNKALTVLSSHIM